MLLPQERIPWILRKLAFRRDVLFRLPPCSSLQRSRYCEADTAKPILHTSHTVYLTFDDGPIPESTPWLLETLKEYGAKATFFMVADNARRYPDLFRAVVADGHAIGNHTFHHRPPFRQSMQEFLADVHLADDVLRSLLRLKTEDLRLFRPPHGLIRRSQQKALQKEGYTIVMFDLNTLDYRADRTPEAILSSVRKNVRPGCIINLHDSLKSIDKLKHCLPRILAFLKESGYSLDPINPDQSRSIPINPDQSRSIPINPDQSRPIPTNPDQSRSIPTNPDQSRSIPTNLDQSRPIPINPQKPNNPTTQQPCPSLKPP